VTVTGPTGVGIPNRQVRFDVVTGAYGIQSSDPANPLVQTLTVVSDQFGVAQVILQAQAGVPTQPALLRATELTSGNQQTAQFTIVQTINGGAVLSVIPTDITFMGADNTACSNGFRGDYFIFGGTPPYQVSATPPLGVILANVPVQVAGGFFSVISKSDQCVNPETLLIVDAAGLTTTATFHNLVGTGAPPTPPPTPPAALTVTPDTQPLACDGGSASVFISGGVPPYNVTAQTITVNGKSTTPLIGSPSLPGPGFDLITPENQPNGLATPPGTTYNFGVSDSGGAQQQSQTFKIKCS
jgi:hypothetical protein